MCRLGRGAKFSCGLGSCGASRTNCYANCASADGDTDHSSDGTEHDRYTERGGHKFDSHAADGYAGRSAERDYTEWNQPRSDHEYT